MDRLGSANKAKVAIANRIARAIYKIIAGDKYKELGYMRGDPKEHKIKLLIKQLKNLGVEDNVRKRASPQGNIQKMDLVLM